jgi:hypothetical protein
LEIGTIVVIIIGVRGVGDNKGEKYLLIADGKSEFNQNIFPLGNNLEQNMNNFLRRTMEAIMEWF